jgi:hypothetical protein
VLAVFLATFAAATVVPGVLLARSILRSGIGCGACDRPLNVRYPNGKLHFEGRWIGDRYVCEPCRSSIGQELP